jgi:hypothetical protein
LDFGGVRSDGILSVPRTQTIANGGHFNVMGWRDAKVGAKPEITLGEFLAGRGEPGSS